MQLNLKVSVTTSLSGVGKEEWDACATAGEVNPFLMWDFLCALEESESAVSLRCSCWPLEASGLAPRLSPYISGWSRAFLLLGHHARTCGPQVKEQGWLPQHVLVRNEQTNELLGVCPLYLKGHSYGEYVFDSRLECSLLLV